MQGPGKGHRIERRVGHRVVHPSTEHVIAASVDLAPLDDPRPERRIEVPGERILCFVVVVVRVEDRVVAHCRFTHGGTPCDRPSSGGHLQVGPGSVNLRHLLDSVRPARRVRTVLPMVTPWPSTDSATSSPTVASRWPTSIPTQWSSATSPSAPSHRSGRARCSGATTGPS